MTASLPGHFENSDGLLTALVSRFPDGWVSVYDRDLRQVLVGGQALAVVGLDAALLLGTTLDEAFPPEMVMGVAPFLARAFLGESVQFDVSMFGRAYHVCAGPCQQRDDVITTIIAVAQDVTVQHQRQRVQQRLALMVASCHGFVCMTGVDGGITYINPAGRTMLGLHTEADVVGLSLFDLALPQEAAAMTRLIEKLRSGEHDTREVRMKHARTGEPIACVSTFAPIRDDDTSTIVGFVGVSCDMRPVREARRQENAFLATVAHELVQPLSAMLPALAILKRAPERSLSRAVPLIERQVERMRRLVDDLIDTSRITTGTVTLVRTPVNVTAVLEQSVEGVSQRIADRGQTLEMSWPAAPLVVTADALRLEQVFSNLLTNASKYTPELGTIRLSVAPEGAQVVIRVTDTGVGMRPEAVPHIFDLFVRANDDDHTQGLGVGLAVAHRLVAEHGGTLDAQSAGVGQGSEFTVRLPRAPETIDGESESRAPTQT